MDGRQGVDAEVTTRDTGEIADEIHDFLNGRFVDYKLERITLKRGRVISIAIIPSLTEFVSLMGTALYIVFDQKIPDIDTIIDGKSLSEAEERLAAAAKRVGV